MQKHTKNQKKKDLYLKKKNKYIPDEWEKMELQLIKNFNNRLVSKINEAPAREDQIDCFFKITSYLQTPEGAYTTPSNANNSFSDTKSLNDFILFFR